MKKTHFVVITSFTLGLMLSGCGGGASPGPRQRPAASAEQQRVAHLGILAQLPPYSGPKKLIAVSNFTNKSNYKGQMELGTGMADMLADALIRSERFIVVERQQIQDVLKEQDFAQSGRTVEAAAPKIGKILNTQALITGSVVDFAEQSHQNQNAFSYGGIALNFAHAEAKVAIAIRVIDSTTGQVLDSQQVKGVATSNALGLGYTKGIYSFNTASFAKTPLGQATQQAIDKAVLFICQRLQNVPWRGRVVDVKGADVYINAGELQGIAVGQQFTVFHEGPAMNDPATGLPLGAPLTETGAIEVTELQPKFAIAKILRGQGIARSDVLRFSPGPNDVAPATPPPAQKPRR